MKLLVCTSFIMLILGYFLKDKALLTKKMSKTSFYVIFAAGFLLRLFFAYIYRGHNTDINCFLSWADMLYNDGLPAFYSSESFTDYPPGYMYILWVAGFILNTFKISGKLAIIFIKLPAIAADMGISYILYSRLKEKNSFLSLLVLFNPAIIINSSLWGQVDSVFTFFLVLSFLSLTEKNTFSAFITFAAAVLIKPQACMYAPLYIYYIAASVYQNNASIKKISLYTFVSVFALVFLMLPFGIKNVLSQYLKTLSSYSYASVNAFNLWAALGLNWHELNLTVNIISYLFIVIITIASFFILHNTKDKLKYFYAAMFICLSVFMLSAKMHERYVYPAVIFAAFCVGFDLKRYILFNLLTVMQFFNTAYILFIYETDPSKYCNTPLVIAASIINIVIFLYALYISDEEQIKYIHSSKNAVIEKSTPFKHLSKKDITAVCLITVIYAVIGFSNLGTFSAPQTDYTIEKATISLNFDTPVNIKQIEYFLGSYPLDEDNILTFTSENCEKQCNDSDVFSWNTIEFDEFTNSIKISTNKKASVKELIISDYENNTIIPSNADEFPQLFDEQNTSQSQRTYLNSTYFDEIYHARTAYEFIHKLPVYEWTHPPLGKFLISLGIRIFGMNTFGYRCAGVLFGILMIPVLYLTAKQLFKKTWLCSVLSLIFAFDFMHYVQTRIATIDVFVTFFIMLMYYFMLIYICSSFYDKPLKKTFLPLFCCGLSSGFAIACKWTGAYAALGIAALFFISLSKRYSEFCADRNLPFKKNAAITLIFCCICFIIIPLSIYCMSYIPYLAANGEGISGIWKNQLDIFTYHSKTVVSSTHSYASKWYTWPLMLRPIWYYSAEFPSGKEAGISAFGNPLVWWLGIPAMLFCIKNAAIKKDRNAIFICLGYAADFLPWAFVERTMFIYHYFPSVPFVVLSIGYAINEMYKHSHKVKYISYIYTFAAIVLFILFYPVLTGTPVNAGFVKTFLRWFPGWVLIK